MWPFGKQQKQTTSKTASAPGQPRMWTVWLLSIATFIVTVLIVLGLFWAGRWVVHQFSKKPGPTTTPAQPQAVNTKPNNQSAPSTNTNGSTPAGGSSSTPSTTQPAPTTPKPTPTTTPNTGPSSSNLINTGPTSDD